MIHCQDVSLILDEQPIFKNLNLRVAKNEKVLISGSSGSGKTSLVHLLLGLKGPTTGQVLINQEAMENQAVWQLRSMIAYIDQDASLGLGKVDEVIGNLFRLKVVSKLSIKDSLWVDCLEMVSLNEKIMNKELGALSGGERQRLALAIVLVLNRPIWILDEPTASLDKAMKKMVIELVMAQNKTIIIISHDEQWQAVEGLKKVEMGSFK